jgi:DMSO/TMAO reductase YedYZ molybdopterin-dependent catalytic subunit
MRTFVAALAAVCVAAHAEPSAVSQELRVTGEVERQLVLSLEGLRDIARRRGLAQSQGYAGVRLSDLLDEARIRSDAPRALRRTYVVAIATDGYQAVFSWGELFNSALGREVIVAIERDAAPLRDGEGRFALVSLADLRPGPRHVKWLARIDVRRVPEAAVGER